jgi:UDP-N-acetylglucosamine--N-acetylmuramyl-(pentapeptide) pyrophosphoryl-undecaprenol N-acetylglucosamine transferase
MLCLVTDANAKLELVNAAIALVADDAKLKDLSANILKMALPNSANIIANEVLKLIDNK